MVILRPSSCNIVPDYDHGLIYGIYAPAFSVSVMNRGAECLHVEGPNGLHSLHFDWNDQPVTLVTDVHH